MDLKVTLLFSTILMIIDSSNAEISSFNSSNSSNTICKRTGEKTSLQTNGYFDVSDCDNANINLGASRGSIKRLLSKNNLIEKLEYEYLEGARELVYIDLSYNKIQEISCQTFVSQKKLEKLYLNNNQIRRLYVNVFDQLSKLQILDLQQNQLSVIKFNIFRKNFNLSKVNLSSNQITSIGQKSFDGLSNTTKLYISDNNCTTAESDFILQKDFKTKLERCFTNNKDKSVLDDEFPETSTQIAIDIPKNACEISIIERGIYIGVISCLSLLLTLMIMGFLIGHKFRKPKVVYDVISARVSTLSTFSNANTKPQVKEGEIDDGYVNVPQPNVDQEISEFEV